MTDDQIRRRFNLSERQPQKAFSLSSDPYQWVRTKDNAQPVIPPPRTVFIPHPKLAPPGMMGSRIAADAVKWKDRTQAARKDHGFQFTPKPRPPGQFTLDDLSRKPPARKPDKSQDANGGIGHEKPRTRKFKPLAQSPAHGRDIEI